MIYWQKTRHSPGRGIWRQVFAPDERGKREYSAKTRAIFALPRGPVFHLLHNRRAAAQAPLHKSPPYPLLLGI
jgi:hypothetical protein